VLDGLSVLDRDDLGRRIMPCDHDVVDVVSQAQHTPPLLLRDAGSTALVSVEPIRLSLGDQPSFAAPGHHIRERMQPFGSPLRVQPPVHGVHQVDDRVAADV